MKKSILRASAAWQALALLGAGVATSAIMASPAAAQDYTTGAVVGTVTDGNNRPVAGAQVTLRSQAQNQARTLVTSGSGSFSAAGLVAGTYDVLVHANGFKDYSDTFTVVVAQENRLTVGLASTSTAGSEIVVTGRRVRQDFTKTATGLNLDVAAVTAQVALPRSVTALTLLAPGTTKGVAGFGDVASVGGSSVAENAYYINGLNITNPDTYVGSARVPFDFYKTVDVQTGGFAAEFGRATGGVINATTKSGSNTPMLAVHGNFELPGLRRTSPNTGDPALPGRIGREERLMNNSITLEGGGALIKDHVFLYGLLQANRFQSKNAYPAAGSYETVRSTDPFYGLKADIYLTPTQHLEGTFFDTTEHLKITDYKFASNATFTGGTIGALKGVQNEKIGGKNWVARYTGNVTDFFQLSAAYGVSKDADNVAPLDTKSYFVIDRRNPTNSAKVISNGQPFATNSINSTRRRFYRFDGDLRFEMAGRHHVRFGMDNEDLSEDKIFAANGSVAPLIYDYRNSGVRVTYERLGGHVSGQDRAFYIQDSWEPVAGLTINAGLRDDLFKQSNLSGQEYLNFKNNFAARLAFSYTPNNDSPMKFTGSYGRYFIPPAMNLGFRGRDNYFRQYFGYGAYTAATFPVDPATGLPLADLGAAQTTRAGAGYASNCPTDYSSAPGHPVNGTGTCLIFGANVQDPAYAKVAPGTKATYEDEFILGAQYRVNPAITVGLTGTYRKLARVSEDTDFSPYIKAYYCGIDPSSTSCDFYSNNSAYYIWNPGPSSVTLVDFQDPNKRIKLTGLQFPTPKRSYKAVTFDFKRADDGVWALQGSVTWSKSKGNTEGTVKSDAGNGAQADAGSTQDFDYLGLSDYSYGLLPNDHRWAFKAFGAVHVTKQLLFGANVVVQSPAHGSCEGYHPTDPNASGYGASSFYCGFNPNADGDYTETRPSPRGTGYKSDWLKVIDLSARFTIPSIGKGFVLRADAFNVFNSHAVNQRNAAHEISANDDGTYTPDPAYLAPSSYQQPRTIRLGFDMKF